MRLLFTVWLAAQVFSFSVIAADVPQRVLFIGNSYTGVNQLPKVFGGIVTSATGASPTIKSATPNGLTLQKQLENKPSLDLIEEGNWDVVVLQGNSLETAVAEANEMVRTNFLESARKLSELVRARSPRARIYFYETWARHPDFWKSANPLPDVGADAVEMQARVRKWYGKAAELCKAGVVPAGDAWELHYRDGKAARLHAKDNSHPEFNGTYLAALVFYKSLYHPRNIEVAWRGKLTEDEAEHLQGIAAKVSGSADPGSLELTPK